MKYQRTGLQTSLLIHIVIFASIFGVSRMIPAPSAPIPLELGILTGSTDAVKNETRQKIIRRQKQKSVTKPRIQQQQTPSETAVPQNPVVKQEQPSPGSTANELSKASEAGSNNNASEVVGPVYDAEYLHNPKPQYPPAARRMKLEGTVIVRVLVSPAGKPEIVRLGKSSGAAVLDQAALNAVQNWSFIPARQGSKPVSAWVDIPIHFHLV